jgi:hypothetical protein
MEKRETQFQMLPQVHLHVVTVARVDIKDGQMKEVNEKALAFPSFFTTWNNGMYSVITWPFQAFLNRAK